MTLPLPVHAAATDDRLRQRDLQVYIVLHGELDYVTYRPIKHAWLARKCSVHRSSAHASLRRLCQAGYLAKGAAPAGGLCTYRIVQAQGTVQAKGR